jgi:pimeloyl-ACP methyl ester carboxylesterase
MKSILIAGLAGVLGADLAGAAPTSAAPAPSAVAPGAASPSAAVAAAAARSSVSWGACPTGSYDYASFGIKCATIKVPLDYRHPHGRKITLAISRRPHDPKAGSYLGAIAVNPGGPGASGRVWAVLQGSVPGDVGLRYDWIGFDPRGVGASEPRLNCNPHYFGPDRPFYVPTTKQRMSFWRHKARAYARACAHSRAKRILPHMTTADNARDLNSIRKALGLSKISYYGFSWGSYLGANFAQLFPRRVDRMILDGVVNPSRVWYKANFDQDRHFDTNMDVYWRYLAKNDATFHLGTDWRAIKRGFYTERRKLIKHPSFGGKLGPDELTDAMLSAGYYVYDWADIGKEYANLIHENDGQALYHRYADSNSGADNENGYAIYSAVQCTDTRWPGWTKTRRDSWRVHRNFPFETWGNTWYNAPCLNWPARPHHKLAITGKHFTKKVLLISETKDAATPYGGALAMRKRWKGASLIAGVNGTTHAGSLSGVACVDDAIATYLATGKVPPRRKGSWRADKYCPHVPAPNPAEAQGNARLAPAGLSDLLRKVLQDAALIGR